MNYLVTGRHPWNKALFEDYLQHLPGNWYFISSPEELTIEYLEELDPKYIFFLHWSWIVPTRIVNEYVCVCFHPSHLPYGRGGSPIQNLIKRGFEKTKLTAFRMTPGLDDGPIYLQYDLDLSGSLWGIFHREMRLSHKMIEEFVGGNPQLVPQEGEVVTFKRLKPKDSEINPYGDQVYDKIRMLDAEGYPNAFIRYGDYLITFTNAREEDDTITAKACFKEIEKD